MTTENIPTTESGPGLLELTRVFSAPRDLVFQVWTDPAHLAKWWGPHGFTNPRCEWDARAGGAIHVDMRGPNGVVYPMFGEYREVVAPERIVFTAGALGESGERLFEILNTVTFSDSPTGGTIVMLKTRVLNRTEGVETYLNGHAKGWAQSLERLAEHVRELSPVPPERELIVSRTFDAPREVVWDAWTDPSQVVRWWGPHGFTTTIHEMDVRPGGVWRHTMHGPDGANYPNQSTFIEVVRPERITYSHGGCREGGPGVAFEAMWTFEEVDAGTTLTIRQVFATAEMRKKIAEEFGALEGAKQTLERLDEQLNTGPFVMERTFNAPAEAVWAAISEKERMKVWYFDLEEFKPEVGFEFGFTVEHNDTTYVHLCRVTEVVAGKKLAYTWRYDGQPGDSVVTFELFPAGDQTKLRLTHEGLDTFPKLPEYARKNFMRGWTMLIGEELRNYVEGTPQS